jgi:hypothetical protein
MWLSVCAYVYIRMPPRWASSVTGSAASRFSRGATQTLSTPQSGASQANRSPSPLIRTLVRSGFPKSSLREMSSEIVPPLPRA